MRSNISRRQFLARAGAVAAGLILQNQAQARPVIPATTQYSNQRYKIAACDWMMLKRQKLGALKLAKQCGYDGVEIDMGSLGDRPDMKNALRQPEVRQQYLDQCNQLGVELSSLAMSAFFGQSWVDHPKCDAFASEWIDLMQTMSIKTGFLPMGSKCDIQKDPTARANVVAHLKTAAPKAQAAGVVLGIEAPLSTDEYKKFLDDVGSPAVKIYYNIGDQLALGQDVYQQMHDLGPDRICQIHCTEKDGAWLGQGKLDVPKVKSVLDGIEWKGWLVVERSRVKGKTVQENFSANASYLKSIFQQA